MRRYSIPVYVVLVFSLVVFSGACSSDKKKSIPPTLPGPGPGGNNLVNIASGYVEDDTSIVDGEIIQYGTYYREGFAKMSLVGVVPSQQVDAATLHYYVNDADASKGYVYITNADPQAGDTNVCSGLRCGSALHTYSSGWRTCTIDSSGVSTINSAISSDQGYITVGFKAC